MDEEQEAVVIRAEQDLPIMIPMIRQEMDVVGAILLLVNQGYMTVMQMIWVDKVEGMILIQQIFVQTYRMAMVEKF
ncbi:MAG: hypothetical protein CMP91_13490 [Gammaproteobacteria bacterium]|nr:hypothetical protein [Gammaproteobacteria bacterium]